MKKSTGIYLIIVFATFLLFYSVLAPLLVNYYYPQQATVVTLALDRYLDGTLWVNNTLLDWGDVMLGASYTKTLLVNNTGSVACTTYIIVTNLPSAWSLTWAQNNTALNPNESTQGDLTLTVSATATDGLHGWELHVMAQQT